MQSETLWCMLNPSLEVEYWVLIPIIGFETSNELCLYHLPGRFLHCRVVLGAVDGRVELFSAHLLAARNVLMDLKDRQPHPLQADPAGQPKGHSCMGSSGRQCGKAARKLFFSWNWKCHLTLMRLDTVLHKTGGPMSMLSLSSSLQYGIVELQGAVQATFSWSPSSLIRRGKIKENALRQGQEKHPQTNFILKF